MCDGPGGRLVAQYAPPIRVAERLSPVAIERLGPGEYEIDCGVNLSARPFFKVRGQRGNHITVTCAGTERASLGGTLVHVHAQGRW